MSRRASIPGTLSPRALALLASNKPASHSEALKLIDRARYSVEHGWTGAALDALDRAINLLQPDKASP